MTTETFPEVPELVWSDALVTGDGRMDETHEEFVIQLARLRALPHDQQLEPYRALVAHTVEHFAREERWMVAVGFAADNCHASHHRQILETMRAVETHFLQGDTDIIDRMAAALAEWFPMHAQTMDAGLAQHMRAVGFDSRTETLADPSRVRPATMTGCGSVHCS
ncbi:Bacteriohemerythrin [Tepidimonas thermarum]|uniref:Bacteriohemerythrin n=1 Tax=Tepidimonas thermarum TaxID=335431 RepID=A0A554WX09_9BURK|nr:hemerythrin domain-containing protein [Tepidimonas thermarum]TSE28098.1 Bacteriohemerythrin [Tepidimonas thermarum]